MLNVKNASEELDLKKLDTNSTESIQGGHPEVDLIIGL